jgi:hypothetical protein
VGVWVWVGVLVRVPEGVGEGVNEAVGEGEKDAVPDRDGVMDGLAPNDREAVGDPVRVEDWDFVEVGVPEGVREGVAVEVGVAEKLGV